jgi:hypothetical protein
MAPGERIRIVVSDSQGLETQLEVGPGPITLRLAVTKGANLVRLLPLNLATLPPVANDPRKLLLKMELLDIVLAPNEYAGGSPAFIPCAPR